MNKEFIPYEQALELKQLGFNEKCLGGYVIYSDGEVKISTNQIRLSNLEAHLYQQAFRWFREKHSLFCEIIIDRTTEPKFCFNIFQYEYFGNYKEIRVVEWCLYRTYEEAEEACLTKLIEIVKDNMI